MWEKLLEIVLFVRTGQHRTLAQILKAFIGGKVDQARISGQDMATLRRLFRFFRSVYAQSGVKASRLATDQPHFYTMVTSVHALKLMEQYGQPVLRKKLFQMSKLIDGKIMAPKGKKKAFDEYMALSSKQTTHPGRRNARQELFAEILEAS